MRLREAVRIALRGLRVNRLRTVLTMLSISIGVAAVILLVAIGNGVQSSVNERIERLANLITVVPISTYVPGGKARDLTDADGAALLNFARAPDVVSTTLVSTGQTLVETGVVQSNANVVGSTAGWFDVSNRKVQFGSPFDEALVRSAARVMVIGPTLASNLFGSPVEAVGQTARVNHQTFQVIGVLEPVGEPGDNAVVMPLTSARRAVFGPGDKVNQIIVQATRVATVQAAKDQVTAILSERHRITNPKKRDFEVQILGSRLDSFKQILDILTAFTASVAAISLVVGGIGVLNIMLVSVTERTREIGIRKAVGATRRAILGQFLVESVVLTGLGGVIGVTVGGGLSLLGAVIAPLLGSTFAKFTPVMSVLSIVISFGVSLAIGLVAGGYPANRAARLRPIEALRYQ